VTDITVTGIPASNSMTSSHSAASRASADVAIVGCGIVGLSCAFHLMRRGLSCVLLDARGAGAETSYGNAGSISVGNVLPQSTPGIVARGLRMLLDPRAPLKLDLAALPGYAGWLREFIRYGDARRVIPIVDALHAINHASRAAWLDLAQDIGADALVLRHLAPDCRTCAPNSKDALLSRDYRRGVRSGYRPSRSPGPHPDFRRRAV
jgi:D-amino-acid dehydrogenase